MTKKNKEGITVKKNENFSEWFSQIVKKCELADLRYNVKGFLVFQPWSVLAMEKMYTYLEYALKRKGHMPYWFPTVIPESNFKKESSHVKGFTPEVFWVTRGGKTKLPEPLALRPTSETAFYQMFSLWIRSYKDLPFKTYQRAQVFRYETKATRPFLRSREFHWIETHCVHATEDDAMKQVMEDMQTNKEVLHDVYGLPFIFFQRPEWDKFAGAFKTFASDVLNPDGRVIQQPSTHIISPEFAKAFDIKFKDKDGKEKPVYTTCYGPAVSRIFASVIIVHGDDKGLKFPWEIAPISVVIVPIDSEDKKIKEKAEALRKEIGKFTDVFVDFSEKRPGEKFNYWEMKGVPVRIDLGLRDLNKNRITIFRRDLDKHEILIKDDVVRRIKEISKEFTKNLIKNADRIFEGRIKRVYNSNEMKKAIKEGLIAKCNFCSVDFSGVSCAEKVKEIANGAEVRGTRFDEKDKIKSSDKCVICGKQGIEIVYIAKSY